MALVLDWKRKLGYKDDPFADEVKRPASQFIVGITPVQEGFNLFLIKREQFGTITGDPGTGKTTFLHWIAEELQKGGQHKAHYVNATVHGTQGKLLDNLLADNVSFLLRRGALKKPAEEKFERLIEKLQKKSHVILVDNASNLNKEAAQLIASIIAKTSTHVIFTDTQKGIKKLTLPAPDKLKVKLPVYGVKDLLKLFKKRIEGAGSVGFFPFKDKDLEKLCKKAANNPRDVLNLARDKAIELSLHVTELPQQTVSTERTGKLFSIKIQRGDELPALEEEKPKKEKPQEAPPPEPEKELTQEEQKDVDMLQEIIETTVKEPDEIIIMEEKPKKKPKKR